MTLQEIFQTSATRLLKQNKQSINNNVCRYFSDDGTCCAVGLLFKDQPEMADEIKERFNTCAVGSLITAFKPAREFLGISEDEADEYYFSDSSAAASDKIPLLRELQNIHDHCYPSRWRQMLIDLAVKYNLDFGFLEVTTA